MKRLCPLSNPACFANPPLVWTAQVPTYTQYSYKNWCGARTTGLILICYQQRQRSGLGLARCLPPSYYPVIWLKSANGCTVGGINCFFRRKTQIYDAINLPGRCTMILIWCYDTTMSILCRRPYRVVQTRRRSYRVTVPQTPPGRYSEYGLQNIFGIVALLHYTDYEYSLTVWSCMCLYSSATLLRHDYSYTVRSGVH